MVGSGGVGIVNSSHQPVMHANFLGKTALAKRLASGTYSADYHPTRADSYTKTLLVDGHKVSLDILDTAGQESFSAVHTHNNLFLHLSISIDEGQLL